MEAYRVRPQQRWRHVKRGTIYTVIHLARMQVGGASLRGDWPGLDNAMMVVYQGEDGQVWVRWIWDFLDGRFVLLESV